MSYFRRKISGSGFIKSLIRDNHGAVVVYIAIIAPVMLGVGALTLDIGSEKVRTLAHFIPASVQILDDLPELERIVMKALARVPSSEALQRCSPSMWSLSTPHS